ncbi:hypothetical protein Q5752_005333 [Cryptotrichosporon argae]
MVLHQHDAHALLPLLSPHLPHALPVVGSILSNPAPLTVYTTFASLATPPKLWVALAVLPGHSDQIRVFVSAESSSRRRISPHLSPRDAPKHAGGNDDNDADDKDDDDAAAALLGRAVDDCLARHPRNFKVGCVATRWSARLRARLGAEDRGVCTVFLAPEGKGMDGGTVAAGNGLVLGPGVDGDEDAIYATSTLRSAAYYRSRLSQTSTLRPAGGSAYIPPVSFMMTHADGSLGALWTDPAHRRKGFAKAVTAHRMAEMSRFDERARGWVCVFVGNVESERMWEGLGWERAWTVEWVY